MPFHLPHVGHRSSSQHNEPETFKASRPTPDSPKRQSTVSSTSSAPSSILKKSEPSLPRSMESLSIGRTETTASYPDSDSDDDTRSTPATSVSSLSAQCPLPAGKFPFFVMTLSSTSTLSFIALPTHMRTSVLGAVQQAWKAGIGKTGQVEYAPELMKKHKEKGCDGGVWEVTMKGDAWSPSSSERVMSKRILINLMTEFAREGYSLSSSFRTSKKDSGKDTLVFLKGEPDPDPIFFSVAFHGSDKIWLIDAPADVGEGLEEMMKTEWYDGVQSARTRERHCREIKMRGNPWNAHSTSALISARCIQLMIMKYITHASRGYDLVGSVDMADLEEGELPTIFYRAKWGTERAVWDYVK